MTFVYIGLGLIAGFLFLLGFLAKDEINGKICFLFGAMAVASGILLQWAEQVQTGVQ